MITKTILIVTDSDTVKNRFWSYALVNYCITCNLQASCKNRRKLIVRPNTNQIQFAGYRNLIYLYIDVSAALCYRIQSQIT